MFSLNSLTQALNAIAECFDVSFSAQTIKLWHKVLEPYFDDAQIARLPKLFAIASPKANAITPRLAIELLHGSPEYHAAVEWETDEYSVIGRRAIAMVGGVFSKNNSLRQEQMYQRYLKIYINLWEEAIDHGLQIPSKHSAKQSVTNDKQRLILPAKDDTLLLEPSSAKVMLLLKQMKEYCDRDVRAAKALIECPEKPKEKPKPTANPKPKPKCTEERTNAN